ncbi:aldehyde-activating protein [Aureimonas endophytica]|uniref:Aldehyde-activating protein n=1 Tax=Aureimonas endophytica TaxID=2027858 RepID=A0A916ZIF4_9HYPH|nr:GFA family protein [Aureimonas endophytica]GGD99448.1 aldehyde-activating protein [Aureimonas endophytica]
MSLSLPLEGGCRCGAVRFRAAAPPMLTMACHCTGCQRMTASAYSLSAAFPSEAFAVIAGEPVPGGLKRADIHHFFCPSCLSWLFTQLEGVDSFVNVRAPLFDDTSWFSPFIETWTAEKLPFASVPAVHSFAALPAMADYEGLVRAYGEWAGAASSPG